ncbi:hypothetical protein DFH27DRAFT_268322 [Peziza echinospora]|nr:hypothetical protein DFH27DRAFT_268322 [Peziza echinospora]
MGLRTSKFFVFSIIFPFFVGLALDVVFKHWFFNLIFFFLSFLILYYRHIAFFFSDFDLEVTVFSPVFVVYPLL